MLTDAPVLVFPDFFRGFILETYASFSRLGAVLSQQQESGLVVLGYASRALKPCERSMQNYSSMKLELLALYLAVTHKSIVICSWELSSLCLQTTTHLATYTPQ